MVTHMQSINFRLPIKILEEFDRIQEFEGLPTRTAALIFLVKSYEEKKKLPPIEIQKVEEPRRVIPQLKYLEMLEWNRGYGSDELIELFGKNSTHEGIHIMAILEIERYIQRGRGGYYRI